MRLRLYDQPKKVGYLGWVESIKGRVIAFVCLNGRLVFDW